MDNQTLENVLKNTEKENAVQSVLSFDGKSLLSSYIYYKSTYSRLLMKVLLGNGRTVKRSLILKEPNIIEEDASAENVLSLFKNEVMVYESVLKEAFNLMEEFEDTHGIFWSKLLHHEDYKALFLEDLEAEGFKILTWNTLLDSDHSLLVLRNLGRFHGICKVLEERGVIVKENYPTMSRFFSNKKFIEGFFKKGFQTLRKGIMKHWGLSWESVIEKLVVPVDLIEKKLTEIGELCEERFNVLNHGDCWINNLMFKYDLANQPCSFRFLNFQQPFYNTPCLDVTFFMYLSIDPIIRRNNYDQLLKAYYDSLILTLDKFGYNGRKPTFSEISDDMDRVSFFGLSLFAIQHAVLSANKLNPSDIEQLYTTEGKDIGIEVYKNPPLVSRMIPDLVTFIERAGL